MTVLQHTTYHDSDNVATAIDCLHIIGASEAKPLSSGWCETGSHGTSKPDGTAVETGWYDRTSGRGLPLARDRSAAEPPAPRFTAILADTAELSHYQERPGLVNLPIGLQGQHC